MCPFEALFECSASFFFVSSLIGLKVLRVETFFSTVGAGATSGAGGETAEAGAGLEAIEAGAEAETSFLTRGIVYTLSRLLFSSIFTQFRGFLTPK
jgi:hypothetical protein